tara:strand:- start:437 stop:1606 length:1170 start_codon:yes stop_codon:yes gene_type:complete
MANEQYIPNFNDPRVIKKVNKALKFVTRYLNPKRTRPSSQSQLNKYLGRSNDNLGKYLRGKLLVATNNWYCKDRGITKQYIYNKVGVEFLISMTTGISTRYTVLSSNELNGCSSNQSLTNKHNTQHYHNSIRQVIDTYIHDTGVEDFGDELKTGQFNYTEKPNFPRLMHPLQNMPVNPRTKLLTDNNFTHEYDIVCCAQSLILFYAYKLGTGEFMPTIDEYINNRKEIRETIAKDLEVNVITIKKIINAMFCGAYISTNFKYSSIYKLLDYDDAKIVYMRENKWLQSLKQEIKQCWDYIKPHYPKYIRKNKNGKLRHQLYAKDKWNIYFNLERQCLNHVQTYLTEHKVKSFLIHDGWHTDQPINTENLEEYVYNNTKYSISIEEKTYDK